VRGLFRIGADLCYNRGNLQIRENHGQDSHCLCATAERHRVSQEEFEALARRFIRLAQAKSAQLVIFLSWQGSCWRLPFSRA